MYFKPMRLIEGFELNPLSLRHEFSPGLYREAPSLFHSQLEQINQFHLRMSTAQTVSYVDMNI